MNNNYFSSVFQSLMGCYFYGLEHLEIAHQGHQVLPILMKLDKL